MARYDKPNYPVTPHNEECENIAKKIRWRIERKAYCIAEIRRCNKVFQSHQKFKPDDGEDYLKEHSELLRAFSRRRSIRNYLNHVEQELVLLKQRYTELYQELITGETQ